MTLRIAPLSDVMGAEITGVDVSDLDDETFGRIRDALMDRQIMAIRDQKLSAEEQKEFSRRFGELDIHVSDAYKMEGHPEVLILSNRKVDGEWIGSTSAGDEWHSDLHYMAVPSMGSMLHALEVPEAGGETAFCNIYAAYETLADHMKERIAPLRGINSWNRLTNPRVKVSAQHKDAKAVYDLGVPDVYHPVVRTHPVTGRKALYVSPRHTIGIEGMEGEEANTLLEELFEHQQRPEFYYQHKWRFGDLVMWDNRCTLHKACGGIVAPGIRHLHRTCVSGEVPA